jgi:ABC-2 type transport system ATP-binding protein
LTAIEIDSLSKTYRSRSAGPVTALTDLSLSVPRGQIMGLLGPNGAGKTTTIKMMCGLVKPTSGTVALNGYDVAADRGQAMRQIGAVLEGTRNVYWRLSAWENLAYFGGLKGLGRRALRSRAEWLLHGLDLWERRKTEVREFSRGMQQKVAIACALIADPPIVLLDEPTLGLDVQAARTVREWVTMLAREQGKTVLLTTHQLEMAQDLCDRVAIVNEGRLLADQPVNEMLGLYSEDYYTIRVAGHLDGASFDGLESIEADGHTTLAGRLPDQQSLHQVITRIHDLKLDLLSVERVQPDLEEVFVRLIEDA